RWFLCFNRQDFALAQTLEAALRRRDPSAQIDVDPARLSAGGILLPRLADALKDVTDFVLLIGEKGVGPWQTIEYYEAIDRRLNCVVLLLEGQPAPGLPFLRNLKWVVTANPASEQTIAQLFEGPDGSRPSAAELWRNTMPYRGLAAMTEADSDFF